MNNEKKKISWVYLVVYLGIQGFIVYFSFPMWGATYTIARGGGDFTTIQAALNAATAGDTLTIRAGTYHEKLTFPNGGNSTAGYLTLQTYTGETVILDGTGVNGANMISITNKNYIRIKGLVIRNHLGVNDGSGIRIQGYGDHIEIEDCTIHEIRGSDAMGITVYGTSSTPITNLIISGNHIYNCDAAQSEALTLNGNINGFTVSNNRVHDINNIAIDFIGGESFTGNYGVTRNGICKGNMVYHARSSYGDGYAAGIYVDGGKDIIIEGNRVYECDLGIEIGAENASFNATGIQVRSNLVYNNDKAGIVFGGYDSDRGRTKNCSFYNNVLYKNDTMHTGNGEFWIQYAETNTIKNNIVYAGSQNLLLSSAAGNINNSLDYNLWYSDAGQTSAVFQRNGVEYQGWSAYTSGTGQDSHSLFANPLFLNAGSYNFHIQLTSPALDRGDPAYTNSSNLYDIDNQPRVLHNRVDIGADEVGVPTVITPNGGETWTTTSLQTITWTSQETWNPIKISLSTDNGNNWSTITSNTTNDGSYTWTVPAISSTTALISLAYVQKESFSDPSDHVFTITSQGSATSFTVNPEQLVFYGFPGVTPTPQTLTITNTGSGPLNWAVSSNPEWLHCEPTSGTGNGNISISININGLAVQDYQGQIVIQVTGAANSPLNIPVTLQVRLAGGVPFGSFDSPADNSSNVAGSLAVTGWALDDMGLSGVKIYRLDQSSSVYIGDAIFVEGARPDVTAAYPGYPNNTRAGWGYMLLTHFLPNNGNGTFTLQAMATDLEGNEISLGNKTITCNNAASVKPFGAIDTPIQGGVVSASSYINWGWVLTPQPNFIPTNGSTIYVYVDGQNLGHPQYNNYRADIASLFPGYANSNGAIGYFYLNTTHYANGLHTIQWTATDSNNNSDGIGSRYFSVQNSKKPATRCTPAPNYPVDLITPVEIRRGYNDSSPLETIYPDEKGIIHISLRPQERIQIFFYEKNTESIPDVQWLTPFPVGASWRAGVLYWLPGPGFYGDFPLALTWEKEPGVTRKLELHIR